MDTRIYLGILICHFFFFADLVESLFANLKERHSGKKHLELILSLCIRGNDRSVEGKL